MKPLIQDMTSLFKEETRILVGQFEFSAGWFRAKRPEITFSSDTQVVLEGAPSSGNSFAFNAFDLAQPVKTRIAHHQHLPFQVTLACRSNIPCLVIVREPMDAVVSRIARYGFYEVQTMQAVAWVNFALRHWIMFYDKIMPYAHQFVSCDFRELTRDYAAIVTRLNRKFGTDFHLPTPEICERSFSLLVQGVKPDAAREIRKPQFKEWMRQEKRFRPSLQRANELYAAMLAHSSSTL